MKTDCKNWDTCRKCLELCNEKCLDYLSEKELAEEREAQLKEDLKNYNSREYH
jgi:Fe-S-cluster-containing hydrogenase component 2